MFNKRVSLKKIQAYHMFDFNILSNTAEYLRLCTSRSPFQIFRRQATGHGALPKFSRATFTDGGIPVNGVSESVSRLAHFTMNYLIRVNYLLVGRLGVIPALNLPSAIG